MSYQLTLNDAQANVLIAACDLLARVGMAQLEVVAEHTPDPQVKAGEGEFHSSASDNMVRNSLIAAKRHLGHPSGGSYGIAHPKTTAEAKVAWDIHAVLRQRVAQVEKHGSHSVWLHDPRQIGSERLPTVIHLADRGDS